MLELSFHDRAILCPLIHNHWSVAQQDMGFCHAAVISPLNGNAMVVEVAGGGVAALGEVPTGMTAAEAAKTPIRCSRQGCEPLCILDPGSR